MKKIIKNDLLIYNDLIENYIIHLRKAWTISDVSRSDKLKELIFSHPEHNEDIFEKRMCQEYPERLNKQDREFYQEFDSLNHQYGYKIVSAIFSSFDAYKTSRKQGNYSLDAVKQNLNILTK